MPENRVVHDPFKGDLTIPFGGLHGPGYRGNHAEHDKDSHDDGATTGNHDLRQGKHVKEKQNRIVPSCTD
jgi:hypothetical protein